MKISRRASLTMLATLAAATLIGCGKKEEPAAAAPAAAPAAAAPAADPLKVAFVYIGPVGDAGWTFAHDKGRKAVEEKFGDKVKTTFVENIPESAADAERVFRQLATDGNKLIFGTTFGYMEAMLKVAKEFPDVKFEHATGFKTADNLAQYDVRTYEGAYLAGVVAGKMSKSGKLGVVASVPIPEVIRNIDSFTLGARSVNPKATTAVVWVNKWFDPGKEREAATTLIGQGVDVLMQNTDSAAVVQTAQEKGVYAFGWDSDMTSFGPKAHLAASVINWGVYYTARVQAVLDGSWKSSTSWIGLKENGIDLAAFNPELPADVKTLVEERKKGIVDGSAPIWKGPIKDNAGKEVLGKDAVADDGFLHGIKFYVEGVDGKVPG
ncbi:BMP family ABC transporter substrate-binding protein [Herbaspirillum seropedicae]|uniref:ABC-type transport system, periplasmic component/surface lipoprotein n=1 Tax=Herbaspirillum seropedicae (strain SmR1) TaxID=757424 RepID=D8IUK4_HERSS|nr:BMP family ABC transporter substrate-binding protein [Herbaspirillum seropedicae]ADJ65736.1 ABC-type transport system, periplasmic component/surface lipoprotein [Herbaspirillum seropedicae SmR1]AKN67539.1 membrane protein [Herbaspirillum seropedicae]AON56625.1 ABC transporter periplasmic/surface lipoprotein [Herbaspirillum seropedicae]NQE29583.1 membrane protein [Herbaspirillum seropedicae]QDD66497.1 BMP family ABC transporter substrate-binding protein [Herbaspirillum seropedicae]